MDAALAAIIVRNAARGERNMKNNARWTDRTGNARQGLHGTPERERLKKYSIVLSHTVPYGIWLEVRWNGRYAIIQPTLVWQGNATMRDVANIFQAVFG